MNAPLLATAALAFLGYAGAATAALRQAQRSAGLLAAAALAGHAGALGLALYADDGRFGVPLAASLLTWVTALLLTLLAKARPLHPLRASLYVLAALGVLGGALLPGSQNAATPGGWKIVVHAALSIVAAALLTLAAAQAIAVLLLDRLLHQPARLAEALRLPSLQASEDWLFQLIGVGFFLLSLALLSGLIFVDDLLAQHLAHKTVFSFAAWAIFGALLLGKRRWGWRGRRANHWALAGYGVLLLAYFGSKLVLEQLLGQHWS